MLSVEVVGSEKKLPVLGYVQNKNLRLSQRQSHKPDSQPPSLLTPEENLCLPS